MAELTRRRAIGIELTVFALLGLSRIAENWGEYRPVPRSQPLYDINLVIGGFAALALVTFILWNSGDNWETFGVRKVQPKRDISVGLVMASIILLLYVAPKYLHTSRFDLTSAVLDGNHFRVHLLELASFVTVILYDALFYQSALISRIEELTANPWWGVMISGAFFALSVGTTHLMSILTTFGIALMYGISFVMTRSLWPTIFARLTLLIVSCIFPPSFWFHLRI